MSSTKSQLEYSNKIRDLVADKKSPITVADLVEIRDRIYKKIEFRPYNDQTMEHEKSIRWKRTVAQILDDGYVYSGKACTDLVVLFLAICQSLNLETRFVKLKKINMVHSVAEVKLDDSWYIFDISNKNNLPLKGEITERNQYKDWELWKKGRDAWDLDLIDFDSINKISN
ncbi:MAG: transglutaminase domain-containing protein [bacterium]|nr:transglutaminase domain-containing protein [bacterium]